MEVDERIALVLTDRSGDINSAATERRLKLDANNLSRELRAIDVNELETIIPDSEISHDQIAICVGSLSGNIWEILAAEKFYTLGPKILISFWVERKKNMLDLGIVRLYPG